MRPTSQCGSSSFRGSVLSNSVLPCKGDIKVLRAGLSIGVGSSPIRSPSQDPAGRKVLHPGKQANRSAPHPTQATPTETCPALPCLIHHRPLIPTISGRCTAPCRTARRNTQHGRAQHAQHAHDPIDRSHLSLSVRQPSQPAATGESPGTSRNALSRLTAPVRAASPAAAQA